MALIAVVILFAVCFLVDWLLQQSDRSQLDLSRPSAERQVDLKLDPPIFAGGFRVQEEMAFHPGHAWAYVEGPGVVRVGMDDLAQKLMGPIRRIDLPRPGEQVYQGQPAWVLQGRWGKATMLAPINGTVTAVNQRVMDCPHEVQQDPYGKGWLLQVRASGIRAALNSLMTGPLMRLWMEKISVRLRAHFGAVDSASCADGGVAIEDIAKVVSAAKWHELKREFLLDTS